MVTVVARPAAPSVAGHGDSRGAATISPQTGGTGADRAKPRELSTGSHVGDGNGRLRSVK